MMRRAVVCKYAYAQVQVSSQEQRSGVLSPRGSIRLADLRRVARLMGMGTARRRPFTRLEFCAAHSKPAWGRASRRTRPRRRSCTPRCPRRRPCRTTRGESWAQCALAWGQELKAPSSPRPRVWQSPNTHRPSAPCRTCPRSKTSRRSLVSSGATDARTRLNLCRAGGRSPCTACPRAPCPRRRHQTARSRTRPGSRPRRRRKQGCHRCRRC